MNKTLCESLDESRRNYRDYINKHRYYISRAFDIFKDNIFAMIYDYLDEDPLYKNNDLTIIEYLIKNHDMSKYSPSEFDAYADYFYPYKDIDKTDKEINDNFDKACEHHYNLNPHHPQYWYGFIRNYIPIPVLIEMLCDWIAVSMNNKTSVSSWYFSSRSKMKEIYCLPC